MQRPGTHDRDPAVDHKDTSRASGMTIRFLCPVKGPQMRAGEKGNLYAHIHIAKNPKFEADGKI